MEDLISRQALCEYALNQKDKSITPNDIMRFPSAQPDLDEVYAHAETEAEARYHAEIVRCEDCIMHGVCRFEQGLGLDGYCSQAERRTDDR